MTKKLFLSIILTLCIGSAGNVLGQAGGIRPFDDGSNPTEDTFGYNNAGDLRSGVIFQTSAPSPAGGSYLHFNGDRNAYVTVSDHSELDITTNLTLEAYIRTSCETDCTQGIFCKNNAYQFGLIDGQLCFGIYLQSVGLVQLHGTTSVADGNWHHVAAIKR